MASIKSSSRKSFKVAGPLRSVGIKAGAGGVRVALNGQEVVNVRNAAPDRPGGAGDGQQQPVTDELSTIRLGRFIAEQAEQKPATPSTDDEKKDDGLGIVVGPIEPIPAPKPILTPRPARLGL